jgi:cell division protease FtsH
VTVSSQEDNALPSESDLRARLIALMGGRAAEEVLFHEVTGGASNDFEQANRIATTMVTKWGMGRDPEAADGGISGRGALSFLVPTGSRSLPSEVQAAATRAIRGILDEAYAEASRTLIAHLEILRRLAAYLVEHERVDGATFDELFDGRREVPTAGDEWRAATSRPRDWGDVVDLAGRRAHRDGPPIAEPRSLPVPVAAAVAAASTPVEGEASPLTPPIAAAGAAIAASDDGSGPDVSSVASTDLDAVAADDGVVAAGTDGRRGAAFRRAGVSVGRVGRRRIRRSTVRRARHAVAGMLHRAEDWLRSSELEADRL